MQSVARRLGRWLPSAIGSALVLTGVLAIPRGKIEFAQAAPQSAQPVEQQPDDLGVLAVASDEDPESEVATPVPSRRRDPDGVEKLQPTEPAGASAPANPSATNLAPGDGGGMPDQDSTTAARAAEAPAATPKSDQSLAAVMEIDPASFHGLRPGESTGDGVTKAWGDPIEIVSDADGGSVYIYAVEDFPRIQVRLADDVVESIVIDLETPMAAGELAEELDLEQIRAVDVADSTGRRLGRAFPERGVVFGFGPQGETACVEQIVIEPIGAEPFVLRAESSLHGPYQANLRDLDYAIGQDPDFACPYWLRAQVLVAIGQLVEAEHAAASAVGLAPQVPAYRLTWATCLAHLGRHAEAVDEVEKILAGNDLPADVEARALVQMGDLIAGGGGREGQKAIDFQLKAIKRLGSLASDPSAVVRRAAKETLIDAHLAVACEIAWGRWDRKDQVVPMWIERASKLADQTINQDGGSRELRLRVARKALFALAGIRSASDPGRWVNMAEQAAAEAVREVDDSLWARRIRRQLGMVYGNAVQLAHALAEVDRALRFGQMALDRLEPEPDQESGTPAGRFLLGQLHFQMGAVLAVHREDHHTAVQWYDKAVAGLVQPTPLFPEANPRRHGDALVSMGVSYWEVDQREKAVELTRLGAETIKQAVAGGAVDESALAVPYGNLATMHAVLGDTGQARRFAELAEGKVQ